MDRLFLSVYVAEFLEFLLVFPPVGVDLHKHLKEYLLFKEFLHILAGLGSYTFQGQTFRTLIGLPLPTLIGLMSRSSAMWSE